jgi:L-ascorbate metabolism protein UlaG (beta-lactamase superfamily)
MLKEGDNMPVEITWLGHSAFRLLIDDYEILIDPFLTGNPLAPITADDTNPQFVLITHGHGDHIGDTPSIVKRTNAAIVANFEIANWFKKKLNTENVHGLNTGGGVQLPFGRVELTMAIHTSTLPDGSPGGLASGILITTNDGKKLYHAGDTGLFLDMQLIGDHGLDLAMLPIGDYFTMGFDDSLRALKLLHPKAVIPMHYNTFDPIAQDVAGWAQVVHNNTDTKPIVLDPGGTYSL